MIYNMHSSRSTTVTELYDSKKETLFAFEYLRKKLFFDILRMENQRVHESPCPLII